MTKQIDIKELIPKMKPGYVACDEDGSWYWYSDTPERIDKMRAWISCLGICECLSNIFDIAPAKDWTKSLIKVGEK